MIAKRQKFASSSLILTKDATVANVTSAIGDAAKKLKAGDLFFLSYSGHGGQGPDTNGDEGDDDKDRQDETWVLHDRMLVDDELFHLWSKFAKGVRILVLSDSCHSGTVVKDMPWFLGMTASSRGESRGAAKFIPPEKARAAYAADKKTYDDIQKRLAGGEQVALRASVLLISGCQDNQSSFDGPRNGKFTAALRSVWKNGRFHGSYQTFHSRISAAIEEFSLTEILPGWCRQPTIRQAGPVHHLRLSEARQPRRKARRAAAQGRRKGMAGVTRCLQEETCNGAARDTAAQLAGKIPPALLQRIKDAGDDLDKLLPLLQELTKLMGNLGP